MTMNEHGFTTRTVHAARDAQCEHGAVHAPIHTSVQYGFDRVEDLIGVFQGRVKGGFNYARQGTPTTALLEAGITRMEGGLGSVCFATGMAAISAVFLTLLRAGDHLVSSRFVFGNTNSLYGTLGDLGVAVDKVDTGSVEAVAAALRAKTRMVFVETLSNPGTRIPDLEAIGRLCRERGLLYVVDNTVTSPWLFQPRTVGAHLVINSLTKSIAGHGDALGGAVTDVGGFDWQAYPNIFPAYRSGDPAMWGLQQIRKKGLRDMGGALSSDHAHRILVGAETLALRMERTSATALALARWLAAHPAIAAVHYPLLQSHPQHDTAKRLFRAGSWLLSFELADPSRLVAVIDRLRLPISATGLGDTRSLIIPVAPTIFWEAGAQVRAEMGIAEGMIRLSVGLEDEADLIAVVIGKGGRRISEAKAWDHIAGYSCYNDGSVRDWQVATSQWTPGKNFWRTGAFGPWMVTADEIRPGQVMRLQTVLNGQVLQDSSTDKMIHSIPRQIAYISTFIPLQAGDVIVTGTPGGVGNKREPQIFMKPGDVCEIVVDAIGTLRNGIRDEA